MTSETFRIPQLDCPQEFALIERRIVALPGIGPLVPNYLKRELRIEFDARQVSRRAVIDGIASAGFTVADGPSDSAHDTGYRLRSMAWAIGTLMLFVAGAAWWYDLSETSRWLAGVSAVLCGVPVVWAARRAVLARSIDMYVLMSVAGAGALAIGDVFEAATALALFGIALWLERWSLDRARRALDRLAQLTPAVAHRVESTGIVDLAPEDLLVGQQVLVRPGERVPVDGVVREGTSHVDQAAITGESMPVAKRAGDMVFAGTLNGEGSLTIETRRVAAESALARAARLAETAQAERSPSVRFVDQFARWYTPIVVIAAVMIALGGWAAQQVGWITVSTSGEHWLHRGLVMLVAACPCALVISTPVTLVSALVGAARRGLLVKGGEHLEQAGKITCVVFDKTGTVTTGHPVVVNVEPADGHTRCELIQTAASLEAHSEHPLASAVVGLASDEQCPLLGVRDFQAERGRGIRGMIEGVECRAGRREFAGPGISAESEDAVQHGRQPVGTEIWVSRNGELQGHLVLADAPRPEAAAAIVALGALGVTHVELLSGDRAAVVSDVARQVGIARFQAAMLPEQKVQRVRERMRGHAGRVAFVGDGVNDAPALAAASLGVALGRDASDLALETADVAVLRADLGAVVDLLALGQRSRRRLIENIALALSIKAVVLLLAVINLAPMWSAVAADVGATLLVVGNGLRLAGEKRA